MPLPSESQHKLQFLPVYLLSYENLATTTRKGGKIGVDLKPVDADSLNLSYVYLLAKKTMTPVLIIS